MIRWSARTMGSGPRLLWFWVIALVASGSAFGTDALQHYAGRMQSGEPIELTLSGMEGAVTGTLSDNVHAYRVTAAIDGGQLVGHADQDTLGLRVGLRGDVQAAGMTLEIRLSILGEEASEQIWLARSDAGRHASVEAERTHPEPGLSSAPGERDPALVGHWVHEEIYNSGSGADFLGASSRRGLILRADGGVADGGSAVSLSGDGYLGQSSDGGSGVVPGVTWFSRGQHLWLHNAADGQTVDLGRYYAEPGRMMVTAENGRRMLFTRAR